MNASAKQLPPTHSVRSRTTAAKACRIVIALVLALACSVFLAPTGPVSAQDTTDGGPGRWYDETLGGQKPGGAKPGTQAWYYEQQIKGGNQGKAYWVPYPETRQQPGFDLKTWVPKRLPNGTFDGVAFDGWDSQRRELLDAKGGRYAYLLDPKNAKWSNTETGLIREAQRQLRAAGGTTIRWHFAETAAESHMRQKLSGLGVNSSVTQPQRPPLYSAPGSPADPLGRARQTGAAPGAKPGGIDFSTLQLQYLSAADVGGESGITYSFKNSVGPDGSDLESARAASDAFFVWLQLDPSQFWVNLHPDQPDRIIDPDLARTDVGRVMLEADVELKRSMMAAMDPDTELGQEFWQRIYNGPDDDTCFWIRQWISPATATVRTSGDELYILDAPLKVESAIQDDAENVCPGQTEEREEYNQAAIEELILPQVTEMVNEDPEYADLRRVYLSRVAAEWYKELSATEETHFEDLIGQGILGPWESREPWDPMDSFNEFIELLNSAEGSVVVDGVTYTFVYGGVDFSQVPSDPVSEEVFEVEHPALPATVESSIEEPTVDGDDPESIWLGGASVVEEEPPADTPSGENPDSSGNGQLPVTGMSVWPPLMVGLAGCIMGIALLMFVRIRRRRSDVGAS